ncbi:MAG: LCP family glycopolymer transferase [Chloroflexus sp.]|uniref:LCP family glycopolymer transferase n=1 Tax=Chloroflexus sp. TaxID=1904827 RepID=UPI004049D76D
MTCSEARALLAAGIRPGTASSTRLRLKAHLDHCSACRALLDQTDHDLLLDLLTKPLVPEQSPSPRPWLRYVLVVLLALFAGWLGFQTGRVVWAAMTIRQNLEAMRLPTMVATSTPAMSVVALTPLPSPQPLNVAQPTSVVPTAVSADITPAITPTSIVRDVTIAASATPIRLPGIDGRMPVPTLMPTVGVNLPSSNVIHILLLGSDRRPGEGWATRADAIMVVRIEMTSRRVALLSLPRDLIVEIPGYGYGRINSATMYGEQNPAIGGAELARRTVSQLLGLPIDHIVWADFTGFMAAVDAIGGIEIELEQSIYDPLYPTMDYGVMPIYFPAGRQWLDGAQALILSRTRHADSAYAREARQQMILLAIARRIREQDPVRQVELAAHVTTALRPHIRTDLSADDLLGLVWSLRDVNLASVERFALDADGVFEGLIEGDPYALTPRPGAIETLVQAFVRGK